VSSFFLNQKEVIFSVLTQNTNLSILLDNYRLPPVVDSFSSSKVPLLYEGNQESIKVNSGSEIERLSQEHDSARGRSSVIKSAQNLAEEWKQEFAAGLDLIADSRHAYSQNINGKDQFSNLHIPKLFQVGLVLAVCLIVA
jgi:hypothetical protein